MIQSISKGEKNADGFYPITVVSETINGASTFTSTTVYNLRAIDIDTEVVRRTAEVAKQQSELTLFGLIQDEIEKDSAPAQ